MPAESFRPSNVSYRGLNWPMDDYYYGKSATKSSIRTQWLGYLKWFELCIILGIIYSISMGGYCGLS